MGHLAACKGCFSLGDILNGSRSSKLSLQTKEGNSAQSILPDQKDGSIRTAKLADASEEQAKVPERAGNQFITGLGLVLTRWVEATSSASADETAKRRATHFHSVRAPSMSVKDYLARIHKYFVCSDECYVLALIYIDRLGKIDPAMTVCNLSVHRLLVIAVMVAAKFHDDIYYSNNYYAKVGGLTLKEVNALEAKMLTLVDWHVYVGPEEYELYHGLVCQATSLNSSQIRLQKEPEPEPES